jgi:hypothetical protein
MVNIIDFGDHHGRIAWQIRLYANAEVYETLPTHRLSSKLFKRYPGRFPGPNRIPRFLHLIADTVLQAVKSFNFSNALSTIFLPESDRSVGEARQHCGGSFLITSEPNGFRRAIPGVRIDLVEGLISRGFKK